MPREKVSLFLRILRASRGCKLAVQIVFRMWPISQPVFLSVFQPVSQSVACRSRQRAKSPAATTTAAPSATFHSTTSPNSTTPMIEAKTI